MRTNIVIVTLFLSVQTLFGQDASLLSLSEYLGYVKTYHPLVKQANLLLNEGEAKLLKARGAFDPKIEVDYDKKIFKSTEYYNTLNATFKIPTWYGIELQGQFEDNSGAYLNPQSVVPEDGLYSVGVSVSLAKGLLINERMAVLKQAKLFQKQAEAENQLLVNEVLYKAIQAYFQWVRTYKEKRVYEAFLSNAEMRFEGIIKGYRLGEHPTIDTTEARIAFNDRKLNLEKANINYVKATLELSNYLWIDETPVEIRANIFPDIEVLKDIDNALKLENIGLGFDQFSNHPKIQSLEFKYQGLNFENRLKKNNLLPEVNLKYNLLSETPEMINSFNVDNYKIGVSVSFPLFLRKERAELKLSKYKLQAIDLEKQVAELSLKNKFNSLQQEIVSYNNQLEIAITMVSDYSIMLKGEERKFEAGESSLFLINSRESKLIENNLKLIALENSLLQLKGQLFNVMGLVN